jgi:hypothetical protein
MGLTIDSKIGAKEPIPKMKTLKAESKLSDLKKHMKPLSITQLVTGGINYRRLVTTSN